MDNYQIRVSKDYLTFCAAHFIIYRGTQCERLHGHNYNVAVEIDGSLGEDFLVFDFIELKGILKGICDELDHRMLVPEKSRTLRVLADEKRVEIRYQDREWIFPRDDCVLLPIENTTAELLARWFAHRLASELRARPPRAEETQTYGPMTIEVYESTGQCARYRLDEW